MNCQHSTLAEVAILEQVEGSLQSALPREALVDLLQSSGSYFAAVGIRVSVIESKMCACLCVLHQISQLWL